LTVDLGAEAGSCPVMPKEQPGTDKSATIARGSKRCIFSPPHLTAF